MSATEGSSHWTVDSSLWTEVRPSNRPESLSEVRERVIQEDLDIIDRSQITLGRKIGEGGQGSIYEARWDSGFSSEPRSVVVKKFEPLKCIAQGHFPPQLWSLNLLNICKPYGVFFDLDDSLCMLMPRFSSDLRTLIDSRMSRLLNNDDGAPFSEDVAVSIITRLAVTFNALHDFGIYHRDINARNILVQTTSNPSVFDVLVADFEISDSIVGTGFYRAPEILQTLHVFEEDRIPLSGKQLQAADVYSFGMTCYEILTGRSPFEGQLYSDYNLVLSGGRPELPNHVPEPLKTIICRCWHHASDFRPNFAEILVLLKESYTIARYFVLCQGLATSIGNASETMRDVPLEECLVQLKRTLLTPAELHTLRRGIPAAARYERLLAQFIITSEEFVSRFGWDSYFRHPSLPFIDFVERRRLVTVILHLSQESDHTVNKMQKAFLTDLDSEIRHISQVFRFVARKFLTVKVVKFLAEGEEQSKLSEEEESELTLLDKFSIVQTLINSLMDAGVDYFQTSKVFVDIHKQLCKLEGAAYGKVATKFYLKWSCMVLFYPFYDNLAKFLDTLFSYTTILLYLVYKIPGCSNAMFRYLRLSGFHEVLFAYLGFRVDGVSLLFRYYVQWKCFGWLGLLIYFLSYWIFSKLKFRLQRR